jgi:inorganic pyrophosphatase
MGDLPGQIMDQLEEFFVDYNKLQGKKFKALEKLGPREARELIEEQVE